MLPVEGATFLETLNRNQRAAARQALATLQQFAEQSGLVKPGTPLPQKRLGRDVMARFYAWLQPRCKEVKIPTALLGAEGYLGWLRRHRGFRRRVWPPPVLPRFGVCFLLESAGDEKSKTYKSYLAALLNFQRFAQATSLTEVYIPLPQSAIGETILADYYGWLAAAKMSDATMRLYLATATLYLEWLDSENKLPGRVQLSTIRAKLQLKTKSRRLKPARRGSDKALGKLLAYFDRLVLEPQPEQPPTGNVKRDAWFKKQRRLIALRNRAIVHTLYSTAGRAAEVAALTCAIVRVDRVDSPKRPQPDTRPETRQPEQIQLLAEKGLVISVVDSHKISGKGDVERTVVFTHDAQMAIEAYAAARLLAEGELKPDRELFVSHARDMYKALKPQSLWHELNQAAREVFESGGRPAHIGPHAFRHLRAQDLSNEGMNIDVLQKYLGHASLEVTRAIYAPDTPDPVLLDQISTFGKSAAEVVRDAGKGV